ncbi:hypothetical protein FDUTEX481_04087 [Tolypothrix sp. PCC 7601]|nr:hypothetical protein FDUTEX481_04087 [Tolypothrix sp. PCC 7601]
MIFGGAEIVRELMIHSRVFYVSAVFATMSKRSPSYSTFLYYIPKVVTF